MTLPEDIQRDLAQPTLLSFVTKLWAAVGQTLRGWRAPERHDFERDACDRADLVVKESITKARRQLRGGGDDAA